MPNQKFILALAVLAIIAFSVNLKPDLLEPIIKNFRTNLTGSSLACNSPDLFKEFQRKFDERVARLKLGNIHQDDRERLEHYVLHIERTETLGRVGNLLSCSMDYTLEKDGSQETFKFLVGQDDDGHLVWHYDPAMPYNWFF